MATQQYQPPGGGSDISDPYEALGIARTATVDEGERGFFLPGFVFSFNPVT